MSTIDNIVMALGFCLMIGSMVFPIVLKNMIVLLVNMLIAPVAAQVPFYATLIGISFVMTTSLALIQKFKVDQGLLKRVREKNTAYLKELREAQLSGNKKALKRLDGERATLQEEQSRLNLQQFKSVGYSALITVPLWMWISWYLGSQPAPVVIDFFILGAHALTDTFFIVPYWALFLTLCSIPIGLVVRKAINIVSTRVVSMSP